MNVVRSSVFTIEFWLSRKFFPINIAESIVTSMNIHQIIECSAPSPATLEILFLFSHLIIYPIRKWSWFYRQFHSVSSFTMTKIWGLATSWELILSSRPDVSRSVSPYLTDCAVPSRKISSWSGRTFRTLPFLQEFLSNRRIRCTSWSQFSTLEKTKHGHHPILNILLKRSFPWIAHDQRLQINLCFYQVAPICPLEQ